MNKLDCSEFFITQLLAVIPAYTYFQMYNDNPKSYYFSKIGSPLQVPRISESESSDEGLMTDQTISTN